MAGFVRRFFGSIVFVDETRGEYMPKDWATWAHWAHTVFHRAHSLRVCPMKRPNVFRPNMWHVGHTQLSSLSSGTARVRPTHLLMVLPVDGAFESLQFFFLQRSTAVQVAS